MKHFEVKCVRFEVKGC